MTTPPPAPFSPPDQAGWSAPAAPVVPPGYAPVPPGYASVPQGYAPVPQGYASVPQGYAPVPPAGYAAPPASAPQAPPAAANPDRPTSMWLPLEGAAGTQIAIYELDKNRPVLVIDGVRASRDINGYFKVPMANGKSQKLKVRAAIPGYPTLKFGGKVVYKSPKPPTMTVVGYLVPAIGAAIFGAGWFGGVGAVLCALGVGYGAAAWIRNAESKRVPYIVLLSGGVVLAALGVVGIMVTIRLRHY